MTLVNARAAFEKAVTDAVVAADDAVTMLYDNIPYTLPSKTTKYIATSVAFNQSTVQAQGGAVDFYSGRIQCNIYIPRNSGTATLSALGEAVIDGLTSVNASGYTDTFNCKPRSSEISGPIPVDLDDESHFLGIVSCLFSANA
tara:strand:- start:194 stop:622 length:429 start_codon:yes stop_codon:yes gene_type:complete